MSRVLSCQLTLLILAVNPSFLTAQNTGAREFKADGGIDAGVDGLGTWKVAGNNLLVQYDNGSSPITFKLPVRSGKIAGKTAAGEELVAEKVEKE